MLCLLFASMSFCWADTSVKAQWMKKSPLSVGNKAIQNICLTAPLPQAEIWFRYPIEKFRSLRYKVSRQVLPHPDIISEFSLFFVCLSFRQSWGLYGKPRNRKPPQARVKRGSPEDQQPFLSPVHVGPSATTKFCSIISRSTQLCSRIITTSVNSASAGHCCLFRT